MLPRFHWSDITTVGHHLGVLVILTGMLMVVPLLVALAFGEMANVAAFAFGIGLCLTAGSLLRIFRAHRLDRRCALLLVGFAWLAIALFASVPLWLSGDFDTYLDALFDAVSALTTTGISLASDLDGIGKSQVVWRTFMAIAGGQSVIAIALYFRFFGEGGQALPMGKRGSATDRRTNLMKLLRLIAGVFGCYMLVGTVVVFALGVAAGAHPVDALFTGFCLVGNAVNTCGFVPHSAGLAYYHSLPLLGVLAVLMLLGATNFAVFAFLMRGMGGVVRKNSELRIYAAWILLLVVFASVALTRGEIYDDFWSQLANGLFTVVSAATTGGMQAVYPEQFGLALNDSMLIILCVAVLFGACSHSTGGGIKIVRIAMVLRWVGYSILSVVLPREARVRVKYEHFGTKAMTSDAAMSAMTVFLLYVLAAALGSMLFIAHGNDSMQSVFEACSYVSNCGLSAGLSSPDMAVDLKVVAMLLMWTGRVEFIAIFAVVAGIFISLKPENLTQGGRERELRRRKKESSGGQAWRSRKSQPKREGPPVPPKGTKPPKGGGAASVALPLLLAGVLATSGVFGGAPAQAAPAEQPDAPGTLGAAQVPASELDETMVGNVYREIEVADLVESTERFDGEKVAVEGEVMGSPVDAGDGHVWVNIESDGRMVGVFMTQEDADAIGFWGRYGTVGDTVSVRAGFHYACSDHAGALDLHAERVDVTAQGHAEDYPWNPAWMYAGCVLATVGLLVIGVRYWLRRRRNIRSNFHLWR